MDAQKEITLTVLSDQHFEGEALVSYLCELYQDITTHTGDIMIGDLKNFFYRNNSSNRLVYDGDALIGFVTYVHDEIRKKMHVTTLGIVQAHRRQGYATAVLERIFGIAKQNKCEAFFISVYADNTPAVNLYNKLGFESYIEQWKIDSTKEIERPSKSYQLDIYTKEISFLTKMDLKLFKKRHRVPDPIYPEIEPNETVLDCSDTNKILILRDKGKMVGCARLMNFGDVYLICYPLVDSPESLRVLMWEAIKHCTVENKINKTERNIHVIFDTAYQYSDILRAYSSERYWSNLIKQI